MLCWWSPIFGPANNPCDQHLTSGGSSERSLRWRSMGSSMFDPGSDIGGSIRILWTTGMNALRFR
ncbi:MAG TPA: amidase family protein [Gallionella sp.]|nr:amidase family protein [Gallionella sp.]